MEEILPPETKLHHRYWVLGMILLVILFVLPFLHWWMRILLCIPPIMLAGTYRISKVDGEKFWSQLCISFMAMKPEKCNLPGVLYIETKYNTAGVLGDMIPVLLPIKFIRYTLLEMLIPIFGGAYEIWLVTAKGREIVAWQGFDQKHFDENLALLKSRSGGEIRGRSK